MSCHTSGNVIVRHRVLANELATLSKRTSGTGDGIIAFRPTEGVGERLLFVGLDVFQGLLLAI